MPLRQLELCDFKSYRGHQVIDFGSADFSCIIGPNGSGKSNLMDAISFVLGVKSSQLRSTMLKDLIYRGRKAAEGQQEGGEGDGDEDGNGNGGGAGPSNGNGDANGNGNGAARGKKRKPSKKTKSKKQPAAKRRKTRGDDEEEEDEEDDAEEDEEEEEEESDLTEEEEEEEVQASGQRARGRDDASSAWVMAVYEDLEGITYKYKRSISSTGTSTYSLNNRTTSYLAYNQSLEKHNILVKAKNFLVFQGDVEAVAAQNPKDLCRLVDQISGSLDLAAEYEKAKAASEKATEASTVNYTKKRSIAGEVKHYREQKEEIERWEELKKERENLIIRHILWKLFHIDSEIESCTNKINEANEKLETLKATQQEEDANLKKAKEEQAKSNLEVKKQEGQVKQAEKALDERKPNLLTLETQIDHAKRKIDSSEKLITSVEKDRSRQSKTVDNLKRDLRDAERAAEDAAERQRRAAEARGAAVSPADLEEYRRLRATANAQAGDQRKQLDAQRRDGRGLKDSLTTAQEKHTRLTNQQQKLTEEGDSLKERAAAAQESVNTLQGQVDTAKAEAEQQAADTRKYTQMETEINEKLHDTLQQLLQFRATKSESDRVIRLKENIAKLKRVFSGVHGRVIDLCRPSERKYNTAVRVVLGRNIDSIVVDHEDTAIRCIEYLRQNRSGQATFIPLDSIQVKAVQDRLRTFRGARLAIDVIQYDVQHERAMQHACGSALVCDNMDVARDICYNKGVEVKAVTLDGTILHKSGLITGGNSEQADEQQWDAGKVQNLERIRDANYKRLEDTVKLKPKKDAMDQTSRELNASETNLRIAKEDLAAIKTRLEGAKGELKQVGTDLRKQQGEVTKAEKAIDTHERNLLDLVNAVNAVDDGVFAAFCERLDVANIRDYEEVQLRAAEQETEARAKFDAQIARLKHQIKFEETQLASTEQRLARLRSTIDKERQNLTNSLEIELANLQEEIETAEGEIAELKETLATLKADQDEKSKAVDAARKALTKATRNLDNASKEIAEWNDEIRRQASERYAVYRRCKVEGIDIPLNSGSLSKVPLEEDLQADVTFNDEGIAEVDDYDLEVDFDDVDDNDRENGNPEVGHDYDRKLETITSDIEKLTPNLKAIDKLSDVEAKLRETEKDNEEAKREQKKARENYLALKKQRCDLFNKAFNHISAKIDEVYKDLTKGPNAPVGGVAYLSLEDSDEPYLSGIKYNAMPPLKRFRDMDQLSGGEKTMAAMALLFAIHSYQPAPFFVLDEVDAALDNTNVGKIAGYIRKHCGREFQFIVISLKGSLYEKSNSLVGIFRDQEVNSSRSLTLDLQQYED